MKILNKYINLSVLDLNSKLTILYKKLFQYKLKLMSREFNKTHLIKKYKRKIAIINTIIKIKKNEKNFKGVSN